MLLMSETATYASRLTMLANASSIESAGGAKTADFLAKGGPYVRTA